MNNWKSKLQELVARKQESSEGKQDREAKEARRRRLDAFFNETVIPAFDEIERQLRGSHPDVEARIDREPFQVTLSVFRNDAREFYYTIREVRQHTSTFAFPQIVRPSETKEWRVQVVLPDKERKVRNPQELTRKKLIDDFLSEYEKCRGL